MKRERDVGQRALLLSQEGMIRGWKGKGGDGCVDKISWVEGFLLLVYHKVQSLRFAFLHLPVPVGTAHDDRKGHHYYTTGGA